MNNKTFTPKSSDITRRWWVVDAADKPLGRLATEVATLLRGKHKPMYAPHIDTGDFVIVINASQVVVTSKKSQQKIYYRYSGYPGGMKAESFESLRKRRPEAVIERAVQGMLPKNRLGRKMLGKLKVYSGADHPHEAQLPEMRERLLLRRAGRGHRSAAHSGRRSVGRTRGARAGHVRQFRRAARAARAVGPAKAICRRTSSPAHRLFGMEDAGRWALARRVRPGEEAAPPKPEAVEHVAHKLLQRYGVVFWRLLEREADWLPPWRELLRVYRRLEARGEIRGGRFVAGFSGEQFAATGSHRQAARGPPEEGYAKLGLGVRGGPAQSRRHPHAGTATGRADRQPRALSRRRSGGGARGRAGAVPGKVRARPGVGGAKGAAPRRGAGNAGVMQASFGAAREESHV